MNTSTERWPQSLTGALLSAVAGLYALSLPATAAAAAGEETPELYLEGDFTAHGLRIGSDLEVAVLAGDPESSYTVLLVDEGDETVASLVDLDTNELGSTDRHRLWTRTGIEGCDADAVHDPASYRFEQLADAEAILDGRTFRVVLVEGEGTPIDLALAEQDLPMVSIAPALRAFPSGGAGCLRTRLDNEPMRMTIQHQAVASRTFHVFVVPRQPNWLAGDPLADVRPNGPQTIEVPAGVNPSVELLWASPVDDGEYQIILRQDLLPPTTPVFEPTADEVIEPPVSHTGTTYRECHPLCPPPHSG